MTLRDSLKWVITPSGRPNILTLPLADADAFLRDTHETTTRERDIWNENFKDRSYTDVFSITDASDVVQRLGRCIDSSVQHIYIPGCGTKTHVQRYIAEHFDTVSCITCLDWSEEAIAQASSSFSHDKVRYLVGDASDTILGDNSFDVALVLNSILSDNDLLNRRIIREIGRLLRDRGLLVGFFPTVLAALEISLLNEHAAYLRNGYLDIHKNTFYEENQSLTQIFYGPIRLNQILAEAGFSREIFEIYFFESAHFKRESPTIYRFINDPDLLLWEIFLKARIIK